MNPDTAEVLLPRILVTGATGYTGGRFLHVLEAIS
jgi:hypothetical protein